MPYTVEYNIDGDYVALKYDGTVDVSWAREGATVASDFAFRQDTNRILVDLRSVDLGMSSEELRLLPGEISDALSHLNLQVGVFRRALVISRNWEEYLGFESAAVSEGWTTRTFDSVEEARKWLGED